MKFKLKIIFVFIVVLISLIIYITPPAIPIEEMQDGDCSLY